MNKLELFSRLYEDAAIAAEPIHAKFRRFRAQYNGDTAIDGAAHGSEHASFSRNLTYEIIETQVSTDIPSPKVDSGSYSQANAALAARIERLCEKVRNRNDTERINDVAERDTLTLGVSVYLLEWDESIRTGSIAGDVRISRIDPCDFFPQPNRGAISDMDYCFIRTKASIGDIKARYPDAFEDENAQPSDFLKELDTPESANGEAPSLRPFSSVGAEYLNSTPTEVITCYYFNAEGKLSKYVFCDGVCLCDIENYYSRKQSVCSVCKQPAHSCTCPSDAPESRFIPIDRPFEAAVQSLSDNLSSSSSLFDSCKPLLLPVYTPNRLPIVLRSNISVPNRWYGQSDTEFLYPYQQEINKIESRIHEKLMRSSVIPVLPAESEFRLDNSINTRVLRLRDGEYKGMYGTISTQADISQDIIAADRVYEMAKRCIGITDSFQGYADDTAISGKAKQIQINQSSGRMASKKVMKQTAFAEMDQIIFELYLAFSDEPRQLPYTDGFGHSRCDSFNRYDFLELDKASGEYRYNDDFLFSCEAGADSQAEKEELWQTAVSYFKDGLFGDPSSSSAVFRLWQSLQRLGHPLGRFNAEHFSALIKDENTIL